MFKFFRLGWRQPASARPEPQRSIFEALVRDLNSAIDMLPEKPAVTVDPATGHVAFDLPEQFPDEALALPKPEGQDPAGDNPQPADFEIAANGTAETPKDKSKSAAGVLA